MKMEQWLAGAVAMALLCALPFSSALAAGAKETAKAAQGAGGPAAPTVTLELEDPPAGGAYTYGETIKLKATVAGTDATAPTGPVVFQCGAASLGSMTLTASSAAENPAQNTAVLEYKTTAKTLQIGTNEITASWAPAGGTQTQSAPVQVTLKAKPLTVGEQTVTYNGAAAFKNVALALAGVEGQDEVTAKANLTAASKDAGKTTFVQTAASPVQNTTPQPSPAAAVTLEGKDAGYYTLPAANVKGTLTIQKKELSSFKPSIAEKTYDGTGAAALSDLVFGGLQNSETLVVGTDYTVSALFTGNDFNAGDGDKTVEVTVELKADGLTAKNYTLKNKTATVQAKINKAPLTIDSADVENKTYDGKTDAVVKDVSFAGLKNGETFTKEVDYTLSGAFESPGADPAKKITVIVALAQTQATKNYTLSNDRIEETAEITKKPLEEGMIGQVSSSFIYDGTEKKPTVTVEDAAVPGGISASDYSFIYSDNKNAGTAVLTVQAADSGNYSGSIRRTFSIEKAKVELKTGLQRVTEQGKNPVLRATVEIIGRKDGMAWPTGQVKLLVNGTEYGGELKDGKLAIDLPDLTGQTSCTFQAKYLGDVNYGAKDMEIGRAHV